MWCNLAIAAVKTASGSTGHGGIVDSSVAVGQQQCEGCLLCFAGLLQGGKKDQIFAELNVCDDMEDQLLLLMLCFNWSACIAVCTVWCSTWTF